MPSPRQQSDLVLTSEQVRYAEQHWAENHGGDTWPLMNAAAQSFVRQTFERVRHGSVLVVVGKGNNGGDGYCIARRLYEAGVPVTVFAPFGEPSPGIDAHRALTELQQTGLPVFAEWPSTSVDTVIDALFGSGLNRPLDPTVIEIIERMNQYPAEVLAVDVPSGLNADTGQPMPVAIRARATHSFIAWKPGTLTAEGPQCCGQLSLDTLGVDVDSDWCWQQETQALPARSGQTHKAQHGNVNVVGGRLGMGGASIIAAGSALAAGAGRVISHCDPAFVTAALVHHPEVMTQPGLPEVVNDDSVWLVGPGLGRDDAAYEQVRRHLHSPGSRGVLDADGLFHLASLDVPCTNWVLTPHEGEAARLLGWRSDKVRNNRPVAAQALASRYQAVVVLKGAGTLVATTSGLTFCHPGSPAMATPGMGDCLAGIIAALLAQRLAPKDAAIVGVNWHAQTGYRLAQRQRLVLASDIIRALPQRDE
ncbi:NAD(P)H-hydrate dehydratase [Reinekea blandensis]|nr:NAD(P)H-hydrate dehydratase [Reinekea blandensis]